MTKRVTIDMQCPNGHNLAVTYSQEEFEADVKAGGLQLHCETCDTTWTPTQAELDQVRKHFAEDSV